MIRPTRWECARAYVRVGHLPPLSLLSLAWFSWTLASAAAGLLVGLLAMEGGDLSLLNSGRAPLLANHEHHLDAILGVVEMAWIDATLGRAFAIARFAPTRRGQEAQAMVAAGVLNNCSMGFTMAADDGEDPASVQAIQWWRPYEITLCALPANWHGHVKAAAPKTLDRLAAEESARKAKAMRDAIAADRLRDAQDIGRAVAPGLAQRLGIEPGVAGAALEAAIGAHLGG